MDDIYHGLANTNQMPTASKSDIVCFILTFCCPRQWRHKPRGPTKYALAQREQREYEEVVFACITPSVVLIAKQQAPEFYPFAHVGDWLFFCCFQMMRNRPPKSPEQKKEAKEEVFVTPREVRSLVCSCDHTFVASSCVEMLDMDRLGGSCIRCNMQCTMSRHRQRGAPKTKPKLPDTPPNPFDNKAFEDAKALRGAS